MRLLPSTLWLLLAVQIDAQDRRPKAIRKMSPDSGEKFFPEYLAFADNEQAFAQAPRAAPVIIARAAFEEEDARLLAANSSARLGYRPPFAPVLGFVGDHQALMDDPDRKKSRTNMFAWDIFRRATESRARLQGRQWSCPSGTSSCASIGYPYSCCDTDETCVMVTDTGLGNIGCCPSGSTCGGTVGSCTGDSTPCASAQGGGCCIAGFVCQGVGCVAEDAPVSPTSSTGNGDGVTIISTSTDLSLSATVLVTLTITKTLTQTVPGGSTVVSTETITDIEPGGVVPPVRPTSSLGGNTWCPTGFYACSASAGGGCCQTGRDCQTANCPAVTYTTVINTNGVTVVVPLTEAVPTTTAGTCANGWFLCGSTAGQQAGCCPSGYNCGSASCLEATRSGTASVAKQSPGNGAARSAPGRAVSAAAMIPVLFLGLGFA